VFVPSCASDWLRRKAAVLIWQCENVNQSVVEGCLPLTHKKLGNLSNDDGDVEDDA